MGTDRRAKPDRGEAKIKMVTGRRACTELIEGAKPDRGELIITGTEASVSQRCPQDKIRIGTGGSAKHDPGEDLIEF